MILDVFQVDAFTDRILTGNPAGVVLNADGLDEAQMVAIARELNNSETAFIFNEPSPDYDIRVRFFTPTREVPICGHATISAHYVYARERGLSNCTIRQATQVGVLPVEIIEEPGDLTVLMTQGRIEFGARLEGQQRDRLIEGLGIAARDLEDRLPVQIVGTGHSKVLVPIKGKDLLDALKPRNDVLAALSGDIGCNGFYTFTFDAREDGVLTSGRMFAPAIGINEDPVTGNASGPLGAYLVHYGHFGPVGRDVRFVAKQGEAIRRKGYVQVIVECEAGVPTTVKIGGRARIAFRTQICLP